MSTVVDLHYNLRCLETGQILSDVDAPLGNPNATQPAFLRAEYDNKQFASGPLEDGIYRFERWMPVRRRLAGSSAPITYQSEGLARHLGLNRLFITFSGYWPARGCHMLTGTFKECEAYSVCARTPSDTDSVLVVASAGNTARAFARVCSDNEIPLVVVIPEGNLPSLWSIGPLSDCVRVVAAGRDSDYSDAIALAGTIASLPGFNPEGGARNVARRDGMGTTVLSAADAIGEIPHHYFQAVGSGTGAIAAWEASLRLVESGQFGSRKMKVRVSQNAPFAPIHDSWQQRSRALLPFDEQEARRQIAVINAKVLANRKPPYSLIGGLYEALVDSDGTTGSIDNETASRAGELFLKTEGIDASPAAAVAVADLIQAAKNGTVEKDEVVMLNLTGGGVDLIAKNEDVRLIPPTRIINREESDAENVDRIMKELF